MWNVFHDQKLKKKKPKLLKKRGKKEITFKEQSSDFPEISNFWEPNIEYCGVRFVVWFESTKIMRFIKKDKISKAWGMVLSFLIS